MKLKVVIFIAAAVLTARAAYAQGAEPQWIHEAWRDANYPPGVWYTGFSQNTPPPKSNTAEHLKNLERDALNKLVESISVRVSGASTVEKTNLRTSQGGGAARSASSTDYKQKIQASASADIAMSEVRSYHDRLTGKIYAFAAVRKSDLASYYVSRVDYHIQRAENAISEAMQLTRLNKSGEAQRKHADAKNNLDECAQYLKLLSTVDHESGEARRLLARETALRQEITAAAAEAEKTMLFYVYGTETLGGARRDIVISKLKSVMSKNGYRVADSQHGAGYALRVEVKDCNARTTPDYAFCYACVRVEAVNVKTGNNEGSVDFIGSKAGWDNQEAACVKAFEGAAEEIWAKMKEDINVFK